MAYGRMRVGILKLKQNGKKQVEERMDKSDLTETKGA